MVTRSPSGNPKTLAREAQVDHHWEQAEGLVEYMIGIDALVKDWTFVEPKGHDWTVWKGGCLWAAIERRYNYHCMAEGKLRAGGGPYYCPECEERPEGWPAMLCVDCAWDAYLRDEAVSVARRLGH